MAAKEGTGYGEGDGTITGGRLKGTMRWINHPHRRSDGVMLPDLHGVIRTDDGATVMLSLQGRTVFGPSGTGGQILAALFETDDDRYRWLNAAFCVLEGVISSGVLSMHARVYCCVNELI